MRRRDKQPPRTKKYYRSTKSGAGMTKAGVARYRRENPGSKLKTAVTKKTGLTAREKARRKSFCARCIFAMMVKMVLVLINIVT
jgi:hypothetical protein